jgi:hypothetical protein
LERESADGCELVGVEVMDDEPVERSEVIEIVIEGVGSVLVPLTASEAQLQRVLRAVRSC